MLHSQDAAHKGKPGNQGQEVWINAQVNNLGWELRVHLRDTKGSPNHFNSDSWSYNQKIGDF